MSSARIRLLPVDVVNRIAAGEVVERPASVVKELVENSLDAGASRVEIEVREGGRKGIRITDDGYGIAEEDLELVFLSHSTSKLSDVDDLLHIGTLGFRGEALASIGAVSRAKITSRPAECAEGFSIENEFGEIGEVRPAAAGAGTTIEVDELFRNVPARLKFLKSPPAEMARVSETVYRLAISTPGVEFRLTHGGREVAHFPADMGMRERIARAYGRDLLEELIETTGTLGDMHLLGLMGPPSRTRADTTRMLFFLNGRHVRDRTLLHAARHAYEDLIFGRRSPYVFVFLTMDPARVDQNVHPAKLEVRFRDSGAVHSLVYRTLRGALTAADLAHPIDLPEAPGAVEREGRIRDAVGDFLRHGDHRERSLFSRGVVGAGRPSAGGEIGRAVDFLQVRDTYVILETEEGITILDQHALHERVLYDRFKSRYLKGEVEIQRLLTPAVIELTPVEITTLLSAREELKAIGVIVDEFGEDAVAVRGLPAAAGSASPLRIVEGLVAKLAGEGALGREELVENLLATLACRAAVKAGDGLRRDQVADLLSAAEQLTHSHTCPHGRPTALSLSYGSLERHFKRK